MLSTEEKADLIIQDIRKETDTNPVRIFRNIAAKEYVSIHGPEHHVLDGACILTAYYNAGGKLNLEESLFQLKNQGLKMPGAMCGLWGVCGAVTSIGAALSIIDDTGPLSDDGTWGSHMAFTSKATEELGAINGPRCCKRDTMTAFKHAVAYINSHYDVHLDYEKTECVYSEYNPQCIRDRCPFFSETR
jgi:hypothetical protein